MRDTIAAMLRHIARAASLVAAILLAIAAGGCGIKGPLTLPPKPDPSQSQEREAPAKRSP